MSLSVKRESYTHYGPSKCWRGSCHYNLNLLMFWRSLILDCIKGDTNALSMLWRLYDAKNIPENEVDEHYFRKSFKNLIYPPNWTDDQLKEFALGNSEMRCGDAC